MFSFNKDWLKGVLELIRIKERKFGGVFNEAISKPHTLYEKWKFEADLY